MVSIIRADLMSLLDVSNNPGREMKSRINNTDIDQPNFTETTCAVPVQALETNTNDIPGKQ